MSPKIYYTLLLVFLVQLSFAQTEIKRTIHFEFDQHSISQKEKQQLDSIAALAKRSQGYAITLYGHTDAIGSEQYNESLAQSRYEAVKNYLVSQNLDASRIQVSGFGEKNPVAENNNRSNRAQNRRVELTLMIHTPPVEDAATTSPVSVPEPQKPVTSKKVTADGVVIEYKGGECPIDISLVTNVDQMETRNFTTETTDGEALRSNVMFCVKRTSPNGPCQLDEPVIVLIPVNNRAALCRALNVNFYEAADSGGAVYWKQVPRTYEVVTVEGREYFRLEIKNACAPCKNFDCPAGTVPIYVKVNSQRYVTTKLTAVYRTENTLLTGSRRRNNTWKVMRLTQGNTNDEVIKIELSDQRGQKRTIEVQLKDLHQRKHYKYVMKRRELLLELES